jgi:hypothetical protein
MEVLQLEARDARLPFVVLTFLVAILTIAISVAVIHRRCQKRLVIEKNALLPSDSRHVYLQTRNS